MRLGFVMEQLAAPVPGGTGRYSRELALALAAAASPQDTVCGVLAWRREVPTLDGVAGPRRLPAPPRLLAEAWRRGLPPRVGGVDIVHAPTALAPAPSGKPLVVTVHDAVPWTHPETLTPRGASWHRAIVARSVAAGAVIVTPTQAVADALADALPGLTAPEVLGGGVSPVLTQPDSDADSRALLTRLAVGERYLITVSTLEPRKGLGLAIAALARLGPDAPRLVVVGQAGWGGVDPGAAAAAAGLPTDKLIVLGRRPDHELRVLIRGACGLLMPSLAEGFGLPVAEAMAIGTPVVCSDIPALREVAGGAALLIDPSDVNAFAGAIRALDDPEQASSMRRRGLEQAGRHTWPAVAERAWALYRRLLG